MFQRDRIGPCGVMVGRQKADRAVWQDGVKIVASQGAIVDAIITALPHDHSAIRVGRCIGADRLCQRGWPFDTQKLQMCQFRAAHEKVQMAFNETRQHSRALGVDDLTV